MSSTRAGEEVVFEVDASAFGSVLESRIGRFYAMMLGGNSPNPGSI